MLQLESGPWTGSGTDSKEQGASWRGQKPQPSARTVSGCLLKVNRLIFLKRGTPPPPPHSTYSNTNLREKKSSHLTPNPMSSLCAPPSSHGIGGRRSKTSSDRHDPVCPPPTLVQRIGIKGGLGVAWSQARTWQPAGLL